MPLPLHSSNMLYNVAFNTQNDFTIGFTYIMNTQNNITLENNGFSIFFIDGRIPALSGGGYGPGLGAVSSTDSSATSAVSGIFYTLAFDVLGNFSLFNTISAFWTGIIPSSPFRIAARATTDFTFISSIVPTDTSIFYANQQKTIRVGIRKNFQQIVIYSLTNSTYNKIATIDTLIPLNTLPPTAKVGIGYSGDTLFTVSDITLNYL